MFEINHIYNYVLFLLNDCKLSVTLHPLINESLISSSKLIRFNIHSNPYCILLKSDMILLKNSTLTVSEISVAVGYQNSSYFTQTFKKHTGMSPIEYRHSF